MMLMAKFLFVMVVVTVLAVQFTGKSIGQMRREGGIFQAVENTIQEENDDAFNRLLEDFYK